MLMINERLKLSLRRRNLQTNRRKRKSRNILRRERTVSRKFWKKPESM